MLFRPTSLRSISLQNRLVMAPMTRCRATPEHVPTPIMATYYGQRASMGLIITEGVAPSANGAGYARIPGVWSAEQVAAWRPVTEAVHARGGRIFMQLMHTGRASHVANLPPGAEIVGPTDTPLPAELWTDSAGQQKASPPRAMTSADLESTLHEFVVASKNAVEAGFDGVELHAANGYLLEQFLNGNVNTRTDIWGGTPAGRNRFVLEVAAAVVAAIGADRVGIRVSPYGAFNATGAFPDVEPQYLALVDALSGLNLAYLHLVDHSSIGAPAIPAAFVAELRKRFKGAFIASGGYDAARAEAVLASGAADLVAFGRPALANPDLVHRLAHGLPLNAPDLGSFYTPGEKGYTDYPTAG